LRQSIIIMRKENLQTAI